MLMSPWWAAHFKVLFPNYFILGVYPLPVSPCIICVYNDILISSPAWMEWKPPPPGRRAFLLSNLMLCTFSVYHLSAGWLVIGPRENEVEEEGIGEEQERKCDLSHFRGELSSRPGLVVVYQILSKPFPRSNTLSLTAWTTQNIHFKPQSLLSILSLLWQPLSELLSCQICVEAQE